MSITLEDTSTQQSALLATVDGGYAILNANFTNDDSSLLAKSGGLYASFISYNLSLPIRQAQLYQVTLDNITYNGLYCDYDTLGGLLGDYGKAIIPMILAASANGVIYFISQTGSAKEANRLNETRNKAGEITENINQKASTFNIKMAANLFSGGLFVFSHSAFSTTFSFSDVNSKPEFKFPSQLFWFIPIALNVAMLIYIIIRKFKDKKIEITSSYSKYLLIILALYNSETSAIINRVKIFDKVKEFENKVKIRAFLDTFIKNVPQLVIQILYFNSIVTYSIIPFLTLCTTVFMICLTCVRSGFDFFKDGKKNANNEDDNEKKDNNWVAKRVNEWINDENVKTENVETENVKTENVKTDNVKTEDVKTEDVKTEDIQ
ncbi:24979_t:CDS:2 [Gigaspora margarita]|uniref:24979_t:CDS:1 n=1 Tax=Gigaspora margarita TaxID=4874 RepID=A0ABM8W0S1_GIGMA|nr:24979_t:CDS:2 [Gigaspora margarita]